MTSPGRPSVLRNAPRVGAAAWVAAALLAGVAIDADARSVRPPGSASHDLVRRTVESSVPYSFGDWVGRNVPPTPATVAILRPNAVLRRDYRNLVTGETVAVLFVHCSDARDLVGHYPPVCYPAHGLTAGPWERRVSEVAGTTVRSVRYSFDGGRADGSTSICVDNFMILPNGDTAPDMTAVERIAGDSSRRHLGAGQFQVVTDGSAPAARRDRIFEEFAEALLPALRANLRERIDD